MNKFIVKTITKVICLTVLLTVVLSLCRSPVITNEVALMQMQTSDVSFMFFELFNKIRPIIRIVLSIISGYMIYSIGNDIYKYWKEITTTEQEKEN